MTITTEVVTYHCTPDGRRFKSAAEAERWLSRGKVEDAITRALYAMHLGNVCDNRTNASFHHLSSNKEAVAIMLDFMTITLDIKLKETPTS